MTLPMLILDFPPPTSPEYEARAKLFGKQWPISWVAGNNFFRPLSTLATIGYAVTAWSLSRPFKNVGSALAEKRDWRLYALSAALHVSVIVHSALNMQPLNDKMASLAGLDSHGNKDSEAAIKAGKVDAVDTATKWMNWNIYRLVIPAVTGGISIYQNFML